MELTVFLKMFFDASVFLTLFGYLVSCFTPVSLLSSAAIFMALGAGAGFLMRERTGFMRYAPVMLGLVGFLFAKTIGDAALVAILIGYLFYIVHKQMYLNDDDDFKDMFVRQFVICLLPCLLAAVTVRFDKLNGQLLPYMLIIALCGVALLRTLRHNRDVIDSSAFKVSNILTIILVCGATLVLSSEVFLNALAGGVGFIYENVILKIFSVLLYCALSFLSLFSRLFAWIFRREVKFADNPNTSGLGNPNEQNWEEVLQTRVPAPLVWAFAALVVALVLLLLYRGLKALAGRNRRFDNSNSISISREAITPQNDIKINPFARRTPRESVRHQYKKFMRECISRGFVIKKSHDTLQINEGAREHFVGAPLDEMRQVYLKARYTDHDITRDEAARAKELYNEIKRTSEIEKGSI